MIGQPILHNQVFEKPGEGGIGPSLMLLELRRS